MDHEDRDGDYFCDSCGIRVTHSTELIPADRLEETDHLVLYIIGASAVPTIEAGTKGVYAQYPDEVPGETLNPSVKMAVFRVVDAEGGVYLISRGDTPHLGCGCGCCQSEELKRITDRNKMTRRV